MRLPIPLVVSALVLTLSALAACGGSKPDTTQPVEPTRPDYRARVAERIAAAADAPVFTLRHNPATCSCPPYEVLLGHVWHRVAFDAADEDDPVVLQLTREVEQAQRERRTRSFLVQGSLDDTLATCGRGAIYVTLKPTAYGPPPPDPSPEDDGDADAD